MAQRSNRFARFLPASVWWLQFLDDNSQNLGHAPCLCNAANRPMWRVTFKNFIDLPQAGIRDVLSQGHEPLSGLPPGVFAIPLHF